LPSDFHLLPALKENIGCQILKTISMWRQLWHDG